MGTLRTISKLTDAMDKVLTGYQPTVKEHKEPKSLKYIDVFPALMDLQTAAYDKKAEYIREHGSTEKDIIGQYDAAIKTANTAINKVHNLYKED